MGTLLAIGAAVAGAVVWIAFIYAVMYLGTLVPGKRVEKD